MNMLAYLLLLLLSFSSSCDNLHSRPIPAQPYDIIHMTVSFIDNDILKVLSL